MTTTSCAVLGGGPMGLAAALELVSAGHSVDLYEADDRLGGMSASFDLDGTRIERYYHFLCKPDKPLFDYAEALGIGHRIRWTPTTMGYFFKGGLHKWGDPVSLLKFPHLSLTAKIRYGLHVFLTARIHDWSRLERRNARDWLLAWIGQEAYDVLWEPLFAKKFYEYSEDLSAAWIGTRIKRVGKSRKSIFSEELGFIEGGSEVLMNALGDRIKALGGRIHLRAPARKVATLGGRIVGVETESGFTPHDVVVSTVPLPYVPRLVPDLPPLEKAQVFGIKNIGVVCVIAKLTQKLTPHFWVNINDPEIETPGMIEYTNLCSFGSDTHIVYLPYYLPQTHEKFQAPSEWFLDEACKTFAKVNPAFRREWITASHFHRYQYAQVVCPPGFSAEIPSMKSAVKGLFYTDTSVYYPEDRSMSESLRVGQAIGRLAHDWATEEGGRNIGVGVETRVA